MSRTKEIEVNIPFVSIEEDARLMGMEVKHECMSRYEATELERDINGLGLNLETDIIVAHGTGLSKDYDGKEVDKHGSHFQNNRYYTLRDAKYQVSIRHDGMSIAIENRQQWGAFTAMYLGKQVPLKTVERVPVKLWFTPTPENIQRTANRLGYTVEQVEQFIQDIA